MLVLLQTSVCCGGSLFRKGVQQTNSTACKGTTIYSAVPVEKPPSPKLHDLVKVLVIERTTAISKGDTKIEKDSELDFALKSFVNFDGRDLNARGRLPKTSLEAKYESDNKAHTAKMMSITATIKAEVVEVLPNGNLVVEAVKVRVVNQENETITLTGVIDPDDMDATGSVLSDDVARLKISYKGRGSVSDSQRRGVLGWLLDLVWPF
jgi:flagellar L-ring protein precursor FlgH